VIDRPGGDSVLGTRPLADVAFDPILSDGPSPPTVCVAFAGTVGGPCGCSIYADRPAVCRRLPVGRRECVAARLDAGLPVTEEHRRWFHPSGEGRRRK
jgi:Fe-S-cluster containining protein